MNTQQRPAMRIAEDIAGGGKVRASEARILARAFKEQSAKIDELQRQLDDATRDDIPGLLVDLANGGTSLWMIEYK